MYTLWYNDRSADIITIHHLISLNVPELCKTIYLHGCEVAANSY